MVNQIYSATEVRQNFFKLLDKVAKGKLSITVTRKGKADVLISQAGHTTDAQYQQLLQKTQGIIGAKEADRVLKVREESEIPRHDTTW